jgi:alpha-1,3-rhamnosyl/mannosyltransferase
MSPAGSGARVALFAHRWAEVGATGIGHSARGLLRALDARLTRSEDVQLVACSAREPALPGAPLRTVAEARLPVSRIPLYAAWRLTRRPVIERFARTVGDLDLLHVQHTAVAVPSRAPVIYTVHDVLALVEPSWYPRKLRWLASSAFADLVERAAVITADSPYVAQQVVEVLDVSPDRVVVIPCGVPDRFLEADPSGAAASDASDPYLLFVGQVDTRKNLATLVRAYHQLPPETPRLVLAGRDGDGADHVRATIDELGLHDRVRLTGYLPDEDLPALVGGATALVHPSLGEGFGLTPLEAMACGTPTIVSNAGSLPWVVGDAAVIVDTPKDPDAWAGAVSDLLADPDRQAALATAGRARAREFTWDAAAAQTIELWKRVLSGG